MRVFNWLLRAFLFFTLFAFALNNQQEVSIHWFFGFEWRTRMVFVVLAAFAAGCALGLLAWLPRLARRTAPPETPHASAQLKTPVVATDAVSESRLREGL